MKNIHISTVLVFFYWQKFHGQLKPSVTLEASLNERTESQQNDQLAVVFNKEGGMDLLITLVLSYVPYDSLTKAKYGYTTFFTISTLKPL